MRSETAVLSFTNQLTRTVRINNCYSHGYLIVKKFTVLTLKVYNFKSFCVKYYNLKFGTYYTLSMICSLQNKNVDDLIRSTVSILA